MLENIQVLTHSSIKISKNKIIYIDPFNIEKNYNDADIIFITHSHYDHFSLEDIKKCMNENTIIVITKDLENDSLTLFNNEKIITVLPNNHYQIDTINFNTIKAYNVNKPFHPKENNWVGYIINMNNIKYYIAGDTDKTIESSNVKCDIAFLPIGGKFTMDYKEAAELANEIKPKIVIPIHYGTIVGSKEDAINFKSLISSDTECIIL